MANVDDERERMVAEQLVPRGIGDPRVLDAMRAVPRHLFVPEEMQPLAYADRALAIGHGQTISQPYMVAAMAEAAALDGDERVLEVGTGSGYQTAVLARLAREVITIERLEPLALAARDRLERLGCLVRVVVGDGTAGYAAGAPYDAIVVSAGAPRVPEALTAQLADGGRLVLPVGSRLHQRLTVTERSGNRLVETVHGDCVFVPLIGEYGWSE
jgi:protein-L-isoaspartate(D-aspartate) O-methyltransferase